MKSISEIVKVSPENANVTPENLKYISVDELSKILSISKPTAYLLTKVKDFPCFYIGKKIIIPLQAFYEWSKKQAEDKSILVRNW